MQIFDYFFSKHYLNQKAFRNSTEDDEFLLERMFVIDNINQRSPFYENLADTKIDISNVKNIKLKRMAKVKTNALVLYRNNQNTLTRCIDSILPYFDSILLVDTGTTDSSAMIASKYKDLHPLKIVMENYIWNNDFSSARNFAISKIDTGWCCFFDSDEWLSHHECTKLLILLNHLQGYSNIKNSFLSPIFSNNGSTKSFSSGRFFLKNSGLKYSGSIHEELVGSAFKTIENIMINVTINHDGYSIESMPEKTKRNNLYLSKEISRNPTSIKYKFYFHRNRIINTPPSNVNNIMSALSFTKKLTELENYQEYAIELIFCMLVYSLNCKQYNLIDHIQYVITENTLTLDILYIMSVIKIERGDQPGTILETITQYSNRTSHIPISYLPIKEKHIDNLVQYCISNRSNSIHNIRK